MCYIAKKNAIDSKRLKEFAVPYFGTIHRHHKKSLTLREIIFECKSERTVQPLRPIITFTSQVLMTEEL